MRVPNKRLLLSVRGGRGRYSIAVQLLEVIRTSLTLD
jgi:hypothetical protein